MFWNLPTIAQIIVSTDKAVNLRRFWSEELSDRKAFTEYIKRSRRSAHTDKLKQLSAVTAEIIGILGIIVKKKNYCLINEISPCEKWLLNLLTVIHCSWADWLEYDIGKQFIDGRFIPNRPMPCPCSLTAKWRQPFWLAYGGFRGQPRRDVIRGIIQPYILDSYINVSSLHWYGMSYDYLDCFKCYIVRWLPLRVSSVYFQPANCI